MQLAPRADHHVQAMALGAYLRQRHHQGLQLNGITKALRSRWLAVKKREVVLAAAVILLNKVSLFDPHFAQIGPANNSQAP